MTIFRRNHSDMVYIRMQHYLDIDSYTKLISITTIAFLLLNIFILLYTKILEVNLFAFAYRLFHEDFSSIDGTLHGTHSFSSFV